MNKIRFVILIITFSSLLVSGCKTNDSRNIRYANYIGRPVHARYPIHLYYNENGQLGPGDGLVISKPEFEGKPGKFVLPSQHPVTFTKAYQSYDIGNGVTWIEGTTDISGQTIDFHFPLSHGNPDGAIITLQEAFEPSHTR